VARGAAAIEDQALLSKQILEQRWSTAWQRDL
jgi:hypothetical protein